MTITEKRYKRIEGNLIVSGGEYTNDKGKIIMTSRYTKSILSVRLCQLLCFHNWDIKSWRYSLVHPKIPGAVVLITCQKCKKIRLLKPSDVLGEKK